MTVPLKYKLIHNLNECFNIQFKLFFLHLKECNFDGLHLIPICSHQKTKAVSTAWLTDCAQQMPRTGIAWGTEVKSEIHWQKCVWETCTASACITPFFKSVLFGPCY